MNKTNTIQASERTQHTPGPWQTHHWRTSGQGQMGVLSEGLKHGNWDFSAPGTTNRFLIVAETKHLRTSHTFGSFEGCHIAEIDVAYEGEAEAEANARLIAAAPELLEACEAAYALIEGLVDGAPDASPLSKQAGLVAAQLQAAIAKAGGEA